MSSGRRRRSPASARRAERAGRRNQRSDTFARVAAAIPAIIVAVAMVAIGGLVFTVGIIALGCICLHELYTMYERARPVKLAGFIGLVGLVFAAHYGTQFQVLLVLVMILPLLFLLAMARPQRGGAVASMSLTLLGIYWIGLAFAHAQLLFDLPHGPAIVVDVLVGTFIGDTGAYFGGRAIGRRPLAPRLSPNKTVEGLMCGVVAAIAGVWFAGLYQDWLSGVDALVLGIGVALVAPVGDLFESLVKREAGTKDTGRLFGAHGGALDRLDAVLFTAVAGYYIWVALL